MIGNKRIEVLMHFANPAGRALLSSAVDTAEFRSQTGNQPVFGVPVKRIHATRTIRINKADRVCDTLCFKGQMSTKVKYSALQSDFEDTCLTSRDEKAGSRSAFIRYSLNASDRSLHSSNVP